MNNFDNDQNTYPIDEADTTNSNFIELIYGNIKQSVSIDYESKEFVIKGINFKKFLLRLREMYNNRKVNNLFDKNYSWWSTMLWKKEKITKNKMKITNMRCPIFFALEIYKMFLDLGEAYGINYYIRVADSIYKKTWISNFEKKDFIKTDTSNLNKFRYTLKDYQLEFINNYNNLKFKYDLEGYILSFEQGLGKTFTSIALAEVLNKDQVIIVCPNTLKENWANEIKEYYTDYSNTSKFYNDIFVLNNSKFKITKNTKFFIVNQESISKIYKYLNKNKNTMIIVDESHNFRNYKSKRSEELIELKKITNCKDNLLMSGTPIKASPDEIIPALIMIDPYFTMELADKYSKAFNSYSVAISKVVKERFDRDIYRRTKAQVLPLPSKNIFDRSFRIKNEKEYYIEELEYRTRELYERNMEIEYKKIPTLRPEFEKLIRKYSTAPKKDTEGYLQWIRNNIDNKFNDVHEYRLEVYKTFLPTYVYSNLSLDLSDKSRIETLNSQYTHIKNVALGKAVGEVFPKARANCYIDIINQNTKTIVDMINNNPKKTVIFTPFLQVVDVIYKILKDNDIYCVKIIGATDKNNRMDLINEFKKNDNIDVLIATTQTLSTGVTLTEANQMIFFGVPYRSTDFEQACDRIHRIGQTTDVNIYKILLESKKKNITQRIDDIFTWSGVMFSSIITEEFATNKMDIREFYNELKDELELNKDGFFMITPSKDKEDLDDQYQKFISQNDYQKLKADTRSFALYGMKNYDHYYTLLSKIKKGTKDDKVDCLSYNHFDKEVVKEAYDDIDIAKQFNCESDKELEEKIKSAIEYNIHTIGRVILYPTQDANELESLYMKYMALDINSRASSDNKAFELFGKNNRQIYRYIEDNVIKNKEKNTYNVQDEKIDKESDNTTSLFSNDLPFFTPQELSEKINENYSCFTEEEAKDIKAWRESYTLLGNGIKEEDYNKKNIRRMDILRKAIYQNNNEAIIQCGWIPEIEFTSENRVKASKIVKEKMENKDYGIVSFNESYIEESGGIALNKKAVSIILVSGNTIVGKTIRKVKNSEFSHVAISLDDDFKRIYSYNRRDGFNGLAYESIKRYGKQGAKKIGVYTFLVSETVYKNLEKVLDKFNLFINKTKYSILNLFVMPFNISLDLDMKMVCSEFVDKLLKTAGIILNDKSSTLVTPKDFHISTTSKDNIVEMYNGDPKKFNPQDMKEKIAKLKASNFPVYEAVEYAESYVNEIKEFPIQVDDDGNLLIKNIKSINFYHEYNASRKFLMTYDEVNNLEGMKYELAKLYSLNILLEKRMYNSLFSNKNKEKYEKLRRKILDEFNKYLKIVCKKDKKFIFSTYYDTSEFSDAIIKINSNTVSSTVDIFKSLFKK